MFGFLKRKKLIQQLERDNEKLRQQLHISDGYAAGVNSQVIQLRGICSRLSDEITNNEITRSERLFLSTCRDVHSKNKMISAQRFSAAMRNIEYERLQMEAKRNNNKEQSNDF